MSFAELLPGNEGDTLADSSYSIIRFIFWNIKQKELSQTIKSLVMDHDYPEVIVLSETTQESRSSINSILSSHGYISRTQLDSKVRVAVFDKFDNSMVIYFKEGQRFTILIYKINNQHIMVVGVHLDSPASYPHVDDRYVCATQQFTIIEEVEHTYNVQKKIILGDFNMDPFDRGMVGELSFKATHCKKTALRTTTNKRYFFNPSWSLYSNDLTAQEGKPPGTIHYVPRNKDSFVDYWHVFDQVLIRPELFSNYVNSFDVITSISKENLLNEDFIPNREQFSDHLPIKYIVKL